MRIKSTLKFPPFAAALIVQTLAFSLAVLANHTLTLNLTAYSIAWICGVFSALLCPVIGLPGWWIVIQLLFAPALVLARTWHIPPATYLLVFFLLLLIYWNVLRSRVPLYLSSKAVWQALAALIPEPDTGKKLHFIDIGSGLGGLLIYLAQARPNVEFVGIESAPLPYLFSKIRIMVMGLPNCRVRWGDFWKEELVGYDVVFAYLSPAPMRKVWQKAKAEMRPGSLFISSTFPVPGQKPERIIQVDDFHNSELMVWTLPNNSAQDDS